MMHFQYRKPRYRILRDGDEKFTLFLGDEPIARFDSSLDCGIGHSDICFLAQAGSSYEGLVAAVHATLGLMPEMRLTEEKAVQLVQLRNQLEQAIADSMQEPQIMDLNKLEQRRTELMSKLAWDVSGQALPSEQSRIEAKPSNLEQLEEVEYLLSMG